MGLAGYYIDFIPNFAAIALPYLISHGKANPINFSGVRHMRKPTEQSSLT